MSKRNLKEILPDGRKLSVTYNRDLRMLFISIWDGTRIVLRNYMSIPDKEVPVEKKKLRR